jgi:hypothetical protein
MTALDQERTEALALKLERALAVLDARLPALPGGALVLDEGSMRLVVMRGQRGDLMAIIGEAQ